MSINGIPHKLYSWTTTDNSTCGWLCQFEESRNDLPIIEEHNLLLQNIGGIIESYGSNERDISLNQHFLFTASRCERGLGSTKRFYEELCYNENINPIETDHLIAFAIEAGGNRTFYDPVTKNVLLYATDHSFDYVTRLPGQPDLTFYTINNVKTFTNYVELLARQWLDCVIK